MSYEKKTSPSKLIRFYYETDTVFKEVSEASSFKAASTKDENGRPDFDRVQISTDEKTFMKKYLKEAMLEIFDLMFKIISGSSVTHDASITLENASTVTASYADITDNEKYRTINLDLIDQKIQNALTDWILYKWYFLKGMADDAAIHKTEFDNALKKISEKTLALRQPA